MVPNACKLNETAPKGKGYQRSSNANFTRRRFDISYAIASRYRHSGTHAMAMSVAIEVLGDDGCELDVHTADKSR